MENVYLNILATIFGVLGTGLLGVIAYFLRALHSDFEDLKKTVGQHAERLSAENEKVTNHEHRINRIEDKIFT